MTRNNTRQQKRFTKRGHSITELSPFPYKGRSMSRKVKQKQIKKNHEYEVQTPKHFQLKEILPLTENQNLTFEEYNKGHNLVLHGYAGTGKSFVSSYLALEEVLSGESRCEKVVFVRSTVSSRDPGHLPGKLQEKNQIYEEPYMEICDDLFGKGDGYRTLKNKGIIEFLSTGFLRGKTFRNSIVIVDEIQNMTYEEIYTVMTRIGEGTRFVCCGDFRQTDLKKNERGGLGHFLEIIKSIKSVKFVEFEKDDIVRSGFVKDFIIASEEYKRRVNF